MVLVVDLGQLAAESIENRDAGSISADVLAGVKSRDCASTDCGKSVRLCNVIRMVLTIAQLYWLQRQSSGVRVTSRTRRFRDAYHESRDDRKYACTTSNMPGYIITTTYNCSPRLYAILRTMPQRYLIAPPLSIPSQLPSSSPPPSTKTPPTLSSLPFPFPGSPCTPLLTSSSRLGQSSNR